MGGGASIPEYIDLPTFTHVSNNVGGNRYNEEIFDAWKDQTGHLTKVVLISNDDQNDGVIHSVLLQSHSRINS